MKKCLVLAALTAIGATAFAADAKPTEAQIDAAFKQADGDGNGTLSQAEASKFGISKKAFTHANPDKDGSLDKAEFVTALTFQFEQANPDKDGTLDRKEAAKAGVKGKKMFDAANPDNDGTLDMAEYLQALVAKAK